MAEQTYMGYVSPTTQGVDWSGLSSKLSTKFETIDKERQAEKDALDQMSRDNEKLINSYTPGKDQTFNEMILRGADDARNKIMGWEKELKAGRLKPKDFQIKQNNLKEYWGTLANNAKNYDQRVADVITRQQEGKSGVLEAELLKNWTDATDVKSNSVVVGDDGRVYTSKFDRTTGQPIGKVSDIRLLSLPENIQSNKIDLPTEIQNYTADWQPATMFSKDPDNPNVEITTESVKVKPEYKLMKDKVANAIAPDSNPRAQVSVLADNGALDVNFYYTDEEYDQKYNEALTKLKEDKAILGEEVTDDDIDMIDLSLIKMGVDENNMYNPVLTDQQRKSVRDFISNQIDMTTEDKITKAKSLEYQIELEGKKQTLAEKKAADAAKKKASSSSGSTAEINPQLKTMWNNFNSRSANLVSRWLKDDYKLTIENGKYTLYKQERAAYNPNADITAETPMYQWKAVMTGISNINDIADAIDLNGIANAEKRGYTLFGGELDN